MLPWSYKCMRYISMPNGEGYFHLSNTMFEGLEPYDLT